MRFDEVTGRLGAPVHNLGGHGDGLPLNVAIPSMGNIRLWQAVHGGYSWAIMYEPGLPQWSDAERERHVGYTATYRLATHNKSSETISVDGGPWDTFTKAEDACKRIWRQIRNPS